MADAADDTTGRYVEAAHGARLFLDATPLLDEHWTGIPVTCSNLARALIDLGCDVAFTLGPAVLPQQAVLEALERNGGPQLQADLTAGKVVTTLPAWPSHRVGVGVGASVKLARRMFDVECSIIHDISTILHPRFHTAANIAWHAEAVVEDIASNDVTFCISAATRDDLVAYLGVDPARLVVAHNGVQWPWWFARQADGAPDGVTGPFIMVLATVEPRKNMALVLELLRVWPQLMERYQIVFVGRTGWGSDQTPFPPELEEAARRGRILHTGFVTEVEKYQLLCRTDALIAPSLFEGFGLPVLEALSVGAPSVAAYSSSLPEIGGGLCEYFDPFSVESLREALERTFIADRRRDRRFAADCAAWAGRFTWRAMAQTMLHALAPAIAAASQRRQETAEGDEQRQSPI